MKALAALNIASIASVSIPYRFNERLLIFQLFYADDYVSIPYRFNERLVPGVLYRD